MALQPPGQLDVAMAAEQAEPDSKRLRCDSPAATAPQPAALPEAADMAGAPQPVASLEAADVAGEWYLSVHPEDVHAVNQRRAVPLRIYAATGKTYIGLREAAEAADERAMQLFSTDSGLARTSLHLLKIRFSHRGFSHYARQIMGHHYAFDTMFHKITYRGDRTGTDYGAWSWHGDLPLVDFDEQGNLLMITEWIDR